MTITRPEVLTALALVFVIGFGGFLLGFMAGTDHAEQAQADELEARTAARYVPPPVTAQTWHPPVRPRLGCLPVEAVEPDTMPLRAIPAWIVDTGRALAGLPPRTGDAGLEAAASPASLELDISLATHRTELEIRDLIRHAERQIGALTQEGTT